MNKFFLFIIAVVMFHSIHTQGQYIPLPDRLLNLSIKVKHPTTSSRLIHSDHSLFFAPGTFPEDSIGSTVYDLQSNRSSPDGRLVMFHDGSLAAVWTRGTTPPDHPDRGTGYNYFDGNQWDDWPSQRLESVRTGWPSIARWGNEGELVISHRTNWNGMRMLTRLVKGAGSWSESDIDLPNGTDWLSWPRMVTSGTDNSSIHIIALTGLINTPFNGQLRALVYYRSTDGGNSWIDSGISLPGTDSSYYLGFDPDTYAFAEPHGNKLAIVAGEWWSDLFILTSEDNGENWQKTVIWEHPYPKWDGQETDTLYCPDGALHCAFDATGKLHVVFGITRVYSTGDHDTFRFPFVDGIGYWNEDMPVWTGGDQLNCLDPSLLYDQGNLIGWMQDVNGNQSIDLVANSTGLIADYFVGPSSFPQIQFDDQNRCLLAFSSLTEGYDIYGMDFRHIWVRGSSDNGITWQPFEDLNDADVLTGFREHIYPVLCPDSDEAYWYLIYQFDRVPELGTSLYNYTGFQMVTKLLNAISEPVPYPGGPNSAIFPNPFQNHTFLKFTLENTSLVYLKVTDLAGKEVIQHDYGRLQKGHQSLTLDCVHLDPGVYIYMLTTKEWSSTGKLIIQ